MKTKHILRINNHKKEIKLKQDQRGISLVALIIIIIVLVIISVVSIMVVYKSKIVNYAINGTMDYAAEGMKENKVLEGTEKLIESAVYNIEGILGGAIKEPDASTPEEPNLPEQIGLTKEELSQDIMIGKYVDYKSAGKNYIVSGKYSGYSVGTYAELDTNPTNRKDQVFKANVSAGTNNQMKWRIWGVEGDKLLLISETLAGNITLQGADGYNNAVKILNDACSTAYGNISYGEAVEVRSINQEDIDKVTNMTTDEQRKIGEERYNVSNYINTINTKWPNIYAKEYGKEGAIQEEGRSEQKDWYNGITDSSFRGYWTHYVCKIVDYAIQTIYDALLTNPTQNSNTGTNSNSRCWTASRCAYVDKNNAGFRLFITFNGQVSSPILYYSYGSAISYTAATRPMIEIDLNSIAIGITGSGTNTDPYSMAKK